MTIDERLQFLLQSTESLHASLHETHEQIAKQSDQIAKQSEQIAAHTAQLKIDAENIRRLAVIAGAHDDSIDDLSARLDRLENKRRPPDT